MEGEGAKGKKVVVKGGAEGTASIIISTKISPEERTAQAMEEIKEAIDLMKSFYEKKDFDDTWGLQLLSRLEDIK